jgi:Ca-activated chloride channel family protein
MRQTETTPQNGHLGYLLTAYLFQNLSAAGKREVEEHLAACEACRNELHLLERTLGAAERALDDGGKEYVFEQRRRLRVMEAAYRAHRGISGFRRWPLVWRLASIAAMLMVCLVGMVGLFGGAKSNYLSEAAPPAKSAPLLSRHAYGWGDGRPDAKPAEAKKDEPSSGLGNFSYDTGAPKGAEQRDAGKFTVVDRTTPGVGTTLELANQPHVVTGTLPSTLRPEDPTLQRYYKEKRAPTTPATPPPAPPPAGAVAPSKPAPSVAAPAPTSGPVKAELAARAGVDHAVKQLKEQAGKDAWQDSTQREFVQGNRPKATAKVPAAPAPNAAPTDAPLAKEPPALADHFETADPAGGGGVAGENVVDVGGVAAPGSGGGWGGGRRLTVTRHGGRKADESRPAQAAKGKPAAPAETAAAASTKARAGVEEAASRTDRDGSELEDYSKRIVLPKPTFEGRPADLRLKAAEQAPARDGTVVLEKSLEKLEESRDKELQRATERGVVKSERGRREGEAVALDMLEEAKEDLQRAEPEQEQLGREVRQYAGELKKAKVAVLKQQQAVVQDHEKKLEVLQDLSAPKGEISFERPAAPKPPPPPVNTPQSAEIEQLKADVEKLRKEVGNKMPAAAVDKAVESRYGPGAPVTTKTGKLTIGGLVQTWYNETDKEKDEKVPVTIQPPANKAQDDFLASFDGDLDTEKGRTGGHELAASAVKDDTIRNQAALLAQERGQKDALARQNRALAEQNNALADQNGRLAEQAQQEGQAANGRNPELEFTQHSVRPPATKAEAEQLGQTARVMYEKAESSERLAQAVAQADDGLDRIEAGLKVLEDRERGVEATQQGKPRVYGNMTYAGVKSVEAQKKVPKAADERKEKEYQSLLERSVAEARTHTRKPQTSSGIPFFGSLLRSRMAANDTAAAASCKAFAEAQEIYHRTDYDGDGVLEYAQRLKGKESLYEQQPGAADLALIDRTFAEAEGPPGAQATPKAGYCFKILTAQGPHAPGGARSYMDDAGRMTRGYAVVAYPSAYDSTGRDTFIINNDGTIYQADLGPKTHAVVEKMTRYDPDPRIWTTEDGEPAGSRNAPVASGTLSPNVPPQAAQQDAAAVAAENAAREDAKRASEQAAVNGTEVSLRAFRHFRAENDSLTLAAYLRRPIPVPPPVLTDDGLDEDAYIERYGTRPFVDCARDHFSTFGMDVDTASYTLARSRLRDGKLPEPESVRVEEFVNYFKQPYTVAGDEAFGVFAEGAPSPFGTAGQASSATAGLSSSGAAGPLDVLKVGIKSRDPRPDERKPAVLTFVVDTSGSMVRNARLDMVRKALSGLIETLAPEDAVAIVGFSDQAELILPRTQARHKQRLLDAIANMEPHGATNVEAGLSLGYRIADEAYSADAVNRVILCSDGVANVGPKGPDEILKLVKVFAGRGVDLCCVGFGMGQYNDQMMVRLADNGNGSCHFVDSEETAREIFEKQLPPHLDVMARDAKVQVEFNPAVVERYRLLGYEKRKIADKDFRNDKIDAGEVAHSTFVTAMYEIKRKPASHGALGKVFLRWKDGGFPRGREPVIERNYPLSEGVLAGSFRDASPEMRFLACVARFAELLRHSPWARNSSYADVIAQLNQLPPEFQSRDECQEVLELAKKAQELSVKRWVEELRAK